MRVLFGGLTKKCVFQSVKVSQEVLSFVARAAPKKVNYLNSFLKSQDAFIWGIPRQAEWDNVHRFTSADS
jgi:hypothetical protein